ncbi:DUF4349 domain-containing protein [Nocardiopsis sp. MG754419]|uniref:DUF4349 domain-containing protein n=1 Tax=Nocardiopsis sp. MG754419 TaxID=2259865 RepID=UPI001BA92281|nr:DUF4349 domain-containing protein [Nocardiopsis sp. MG754419]MBR8741500.1 DUF4349 domain-containing protein [Nocardiopsis sp. MG754419]
MDTSNRARAGRVVTVMTSTALTALLLTACAASEQRAGVEDAAGSAPGSPDVAAPQDRAVEGEVGPETAEREEGDAVGTDVAIEDRELVHTAHMTVRVEDVAEAAETAKDLVREADGYVEAERLTTGGTGGTGGPEGDLTLRVPGEAYEEALVSLADLGDRSDLERSVEDVTEEIADVESRIESSETALESLRGYLEEAEDVDDLLRVEREIQDRQASLESFQARLEALRDRTSYSTVHLSLRPPATYLEERPDDESIGFLGGWERGLRALVSLGEGVAVLVGWLLPFALVATVLGAGPFWWWRRHRRRTPGADARAEGRRSWMRPRRNRATMPTGTTATDDAPSARGQEHDAADAGDGPSGTDDAVDDEGGAGPEDRPSP